MPNHQTDKDIEGKKPMGSSKRKRKYSIKRKILSDADKEEESFKPPKVVRTYSKKIKGEKGKIAKETQEEEKAIQEEGKNIHSNPNQTTSNTCLVEEKTQNAQDKDLPNPEEKNLVENKKKSSNEERKKPLQRKSKQKCELCTDPKICSKHKNKSDINLKEQDTSKPKEQNDTDSKEQDDPDSKEKESDSNKSFSCEICEKLGSPKIYVSIEKYRNHMASQHDIYCEEMKKFECKDCSTPVWFPTKSKFMYHLGTRHLGVIKFICDVCTETFKLKANYKAHLKTHNIVAPKRFTCDVCNGSFVNKAGYEAHRKRFPGPHIKQSCIHCGFSFSREKHIKNHRCKTLLLEEAAARAKIQTQEVSNPEEDEITLAQSDEIKVVTLPEDNDNDVYTDKNYKQETPPDSDSFQKKLNDNDSQNNKKLIFHRLIPKRNTDQTVYRPIQLQAQNVSESVVVQELREIDFETGTFITTTTAEHEQQFIVRDVNGQLLQGNQILQFDINDSQQEESQVYLADWNLVAPYVIKDKSP